MLILGTIRSFRASGFNLFSRLKFLRLGLPKRFGLWMSQDCASFLFRLRNAGAYRTCRLKAEETCSHSHQHSRASLYVQKAYDSGQPGLCMMQSRLTLLANLLLTFCRAGIHSLRLTTPRNPQPATSLECPVTTGPVPAGAHGAHFHMRPWSILAMPRCQRFRCALFGQENGFENQNRVPKPRRTKV